MANISLQSQLHGVRVRVLAISGAAGACWGAVLAVLLLLSGVWLDLLWELPAALRAATSALAAGAAVGLIAVLVGITVWRDRDSALARRLDRAGGFGGDVLTGWELENRAFAGGRSARAPMTTALARMAVDHAAALARRVPPAEAAPAAPLKRPLCMLALLAGAVGLLAVSMPGLAQTQWQRFAHPWADVPPYSPIEFDVEPGDIKVRYGDSLEVRVAVSGALADEVELVFDAVDGTEQTLPMFPEPDGRWRTVLARVTTSTDYHVRARRARSERYKIEVITVPSLENVRVRITPPPYTGQAPYEGPVPNDGIAGLRGTRVELWAASNRPLSGGRLTVTGGVADLPKADASEEPPTASEPADVKMAPAARGDVEVLGRFFIVGDGKFELRVVDVDGEPSRESFGGAITRLYDQRPFVRLIQPEKMSLATPTTRVPIDVSAEDDYGISRVQLYRSLNDSRPLPTDLPVGEPAPTRADESLYLPLASFGLEPGDEIKLFARVEDNDPAGAKGSESPVVTVRIISQEEFERMLRVRQGLQVLLSKYNEARRRMEALEERIGEAQKELDQLESGEAADRNARARAQEMLERLREESDALRKLAENALPYDLDKNMSPQIERLSRTTGEMADELEKLLKEAEPNAEAIARQLKKMAGQLGEQSRLFDESTAEPMEHFGKVFPLIADQSRFVMIVLRQIDLAERLAAVKGRDGQDDPALKGRMRDLEQEQAQIRRDLDALLDDVENHLTELPEGELYDPLRETAAKFVADVRASGAGEAMIEAEGALARFAGTRAHEKADEAAEILKKFLKQCQGGGGMAGAGGKCLVFQPGLGNCMGNTIGQMLAEMGLGQGQGAGGMGSGMGGYSAQRGGFGLYGGMSGFGEALGAGRMGQGMYDDSRPRFAAGGNNPDRSPSTVRSEPNGEAGGAGEAGVPIRYRRRVGEYFQRVADEVDDQ